MKKQIFLLVLLFAPIAFYAQRNISMSDAILKGRTALAPENLKQLQWIPGAPQFTHAVGNRLVRVNAAGQAADTLDVFSGINTALEKQGAKALEALPALSWIDAQTLWFQTDKDVYTYQLNGELERKNGFPAGVGNLDIHEPSYNAAYTRDKGLWVSVGGREQEVATSEHDGIVYGESVHRQEFGIVKGTFWSPSGRLLAFYRMDESMVTEYPIYILDSMPAQVRNIRYPYAGATSHHVTLGVYDTQTGKSLYLQTGEPAEQYLTNIAWTPDDKFVLIAVLNREQNHLWLRQYNAKTGAFVKTLFEETNDKWVEPENPAEFVPGKNDQFVWQSERDGFNHLYLYDLSGRLVRQLTQGDNPVTTFYGFSADGSRGFYQTAENDAMNRRVYSVDLKSGASVRLSGEAGIHNAIVNKKGDWVLDVFSSLSTPRDIFVFPTKNPADRTIIFSAKNPVEGYALGEIRTLRIPSPGGATLNARMILPVNFDPTRKYPVLVYLYNGPHVQLVTNTWLAGSELWMHHMAEEGCIVFTIDGRGSGYRGFDFESAIFRHLGDAEIADQLAGTEFLKVQPFVDSTRMGVFGWSYGGFMTTSLMTRPESSGTFKCAVAGGPVIDWRMYEIMYTERYMDTPQENPDGYEKSSLFNYIDNLNGRLLMIHGTSDDVVLWQHSLRYIRECVKKGKQIDYFVYPEHLHNVRGKDRVHLFEKIDQFFQENLMRVETPRP